MRCSFRSFLALHSPAWRHRCIQVLHHARRDRFGRQQLLLDMHISRGQHRTIAVKTSSHIVFGKQLRFRGLYPEERLHTCTPLAAREPPQHGGARRGRFTLGDQGTQGVRDPAHFLLCRPQALARRHAPVLDAQQSLLPGPQPVLGRTIEHRDVALEDHFRRSFGRIMAGQTVLFDERNYLFRPKIGLIALRQAK